MVDSIKAFMDALSLFSTSDKWWLCYWTGHSGALTHLLRFAASIIFKTQVLNQREKLSLSILLDKYWAYAMGAPFSAAVGISHVVYLRISPARQARHKWPGVLLVCLPDPSAAHN